MFGGVAKNGVDNATRFTSSVPNVSSQPGRLDFLEKITRTFPTTCVWKCGKNKNKSWDTFVYIKNLFWNLVIDKFFWDNVMLAKIEHNHSGWKMTKNVLFEFSAFYGFFDFFTNFFEFFNGFFEFFTDFFYFFTDFLNSFYGFFEFFQFFLRFLFKFFLLIFLRIFFTDFLKFFFGFFEFFLDFSIFFKWYLF